MIQLFGSPMKTRHLQKPVHVPAVAAMAVIAAPLPAPLDAALVLDERFLLSSNIRHKPGSVRKAQPLRRLARTTGISAGGRAGPDTRQQQTRMKHNIIRSTTACAALALSAAFVLIPASVSANIIINGGFENPALLPNGSGSTAAPWVVVAMGATYTQDVTAGTLHSGLVANSIGDNVLVMQTFATDYLYQTVAVTPGNSYTLSFLHGKGGDFNKSRGERASITDITNTTFFFSTGYLFPSTAVDGSGTDALFSASLTFTPTTSAINVRLDSTQGSRTFSYFDEVVLVNNTNANANPVPEPQSLALVPLALGGTALATRRRASDGLELALRGRRPGSSSAPA